MECFDNPAQSELLNQNGEMYEGVCLRVQLSEVNIYSDALLQFVEERMQLEKEIRGVERMHIPYH